MTTIINQNMRTMKTMKNMTRKRFDYDFEDDNNDFWKDDDSLLITPFKEQPRAPLPINLPSLKKQKENEKNQEKEREKQEITKNKIETFRKSQKTGIWGIPGWMVQDIDIPTVIEAKERLQNDLATGVVIMIPAQKKEEEFKIEQKKDVSNEKVRNGAFEVLSDKEKMKEVFEKTELCISITKGVECPHGENCRFLHDVKLWKPRKCRFEDTCKCVKFISKPDGSFYIVNNGSKFCKFIHGGESRDNFHRRTKIPNPLEKKADQPKVSHTQTRAVLGGEARTPIVDNRLHTTKGRSPFTWLKPTSSTQEPKAVQTPVFNWSQMTHQLKKEGLSLKSASSTQEPEVIITPVQTPIFNWSQMALQVKKEGLSLKPDEKKDDGEWITPKTQKREEKKQIVEVKNTTFNKDHNMTSLCRSVVQGTKCCHAVCRYAHDIDQIVVRKCGFECCRNVVMIGDGVYRNTGTVVCKYIHTDETRDSYYKRLDIFKYKN
jgi:hypothetical protein